MVFFMILCFKLEKAMAISSKKSYVINIKLYAVATRKNNSFLFDTSVCVSKHIATNSYITCAL